LGIVFVWFGLLKVMGTSPVYDLASHIVYWLPPELFVPLLGIWEMAIGVGLLLGKALRVGLHVYGISPNRITSISVIHHFHHDG
jgi:uncharacterized membrane protein YphA (DoxX/SURF4 family)